MGRSPTNVKSRLVETASELIWKSSYGSVSVDDICITCGVNKGSFYYYFSSKAELAVAAMEASYQSFESELNQVFANDVPPIKRFDRLADFVYKKQKQAYDKYGRVCGCPFASLGSEMAGNEKIIQRKADEIFERQGNIFIATLQ
ncbi:MAG TPA: TetR/AcrR family transcriptional regulator, partial [Gammaproteobacteria bacterium]|nr:TetR/AcrR family transcriptional regulator [Gammaproteobacteria bacterium]